MIKEACSILCKQCEDPLLGLLVARIVENQCLLKYGYASRKGGFILGPVSRNIIATYLLPGFLSGVEIGSISSLSARYSEVSNLKEKVFLPTAQSRRSSAERESEKKSTIQPTPLESNKCYLHKEQKLKISFGASGVDAAALSLVCAMWLQCNQTVDITFKHCCAIGLFSSALSAQSPLLPVRMYGVMQSYFSSTRPCSSDTFTPNFDRGAAISHPLSFPAGHIIAERVRNILSSAALIRWLLVSSGDEKSVGTKNEEIQGPAHLRVYRNRNLSFNSNQVCTVFNAVELFLTEALAGRRDLSALKIENVLMKSAIFDSFDQRRLKSKFERQENNSLQEKFENAFKKSCRVAFLAWKSDMQRRKIAAERETLLSAPQLPIQTVGTIASQNAFDIFDIPPTRRVSNRPPPATNTTAIDAVPAANANINPASATSITGASQNAFDIFDIPPTRRVSNRPPPATNTTAIDAVPAANANANFDI